MKGRGLVLHKPTRSRAALSLTTAGHRDRAGGLWREPADIRSPRDLRAEKCCFEALPLGSQGAWSGLAAGSVGTKPSLGALLTLMVSAGHTDTCGDTHTHTHTKCHVQTWIHLCSEHKRGLRPGRCQPHAILSQPRDLHCPSGDISAPPPPTSSTENKETQTNYRLGKQAEIQGSTGGHAGSVGQGLTCLRSL